MMHRHFLPLYRGETTEGRNAAIFRCRHLELELTQKWLINRAMASNSHPYNHPVDHSLAASRDSVSGLDLSPKRGRRDQRVVWGHFLHPLYILVVLKQQFTYMRKLGSLHQLHRSFTEHRSFWAEKIGLRFGICLFSKQDSSTAIKK